MSNKISRRDFLKLMATLPAGLVFSNALATTPHQDGPNKPVAGLPNILILVADTLSAHHLSLYGYPRKTSPNLDQFAERATVFHSHYSAGNFTSPGTASLLSGMHPWSHRAINLGGLIARRIAERNLFQLIGEEYHRVGFSQSLWADLLLNQFGQGLDNHLPATSFSVIEDTYSPKFKKDPITAFYAYDEFLTTYNPPASAILGLFDRLFYLARLKKMRDPKSYPRGIHGSYHMNYHLETVFDGLMKEISNMPSPFLAYLHIFPPHSPYTPSKQYVGMFDGDGYLPVIKPEHALSDGYTTKALKRSRKEYDEFIAFVDSQFGRLFKFLEQTGVSEQSYILLTSDHGELFERGVYGHSTPLLYDPVVQIPLIISAPGQHARQDIYTRTSGTDVVPTLLKVAEKDIPHWCEGQVLPGFGGHEDINRRIFVVEAKENSAFAPITTATVAMYWGNYKIIHYFGYPTHYDAWELYDIENDPEEMNDIFLTRQDVAVEMKEELLAKLEEVNQAQRGE